MKELEEQIKKQNDKFSKLTEGESISNTESNYEDYKTKTYENGFELLNFTFENNILLKKNIFMKNL
jgi:hypothetical protein